MRKSCNILTIGDEILIGQITDTNSQWIAEKMNEFGIKINKKLSVGDNEDDIIEGLNIASKDSRLIICTGGLGPTTDDITKQTLCKYFNQKLISNAETLENIKNYFNSLNLPMLDVNYKQAEVLEKSKVFINKVGTAPGMWIEYKSKIYIFLPGVPKEMKYLLAESGIIDEIKKKFNDGNIEHRHLTLFGMGEAYIQEKIKDWVNSLPNYIKLAYLPSNSMVKLRLSSYDSTKTKKEISIILDQKIEELRKLIHDLIIGTNEGTLDRIVFNLLIKHKLTISVAESCTGGNISKMLTLHSGSSEFFKGSVVSYSNESKIKILGVKRETIEKYGAVSEETAIEMAINAKNKFGSDLSISCTGVAGPTGGTAKNPVGLIWTCLYDGEKTYPVKYELYKTRERNINLATLHNLNNLRKYILKKYE